MSHQDAPGSKSLCGSMRSVGPQEVPPFSSSPDKAATVRPISAVGPSTVMPAKTIQPISRSLQNPIAQAQNPVMQNSMVRNASGTPQRPVLQQSTAFMAPPNNPDVFQAIERRLQLFKCEIMNEIQSSLKNYASLDGTTASHNELRSLLGSERQMRDVSIEAVRELHARQMQDLTINLKKEIEAAVEHERKERNTQFEELVKRFCTQSVCVDGQMDGDISSQESHDDVLLQESKLVEIQTVTSDSTNELNAEPNTASDSLCESNRSSNVPDNTLQLLSVKYGQKVDGDSASQTETQSSQEKNMAAYSELEGAFLNLSKEFDTRLRTLTENMMAETSECNIRLDEHHTWYVEIVRSYQELRNWVVDLKDSDNAAKLTV